MSEINNYIDCDIALIHPPYIFHREKYTIFPPPWNLHHVGSPSYIGRYPIAPNWNHMPVGYYTMKNFIEKNSKYIVKIINLSIFKYNIPVSIAEKFQPTFKKDMSVLVDLAEIIYPGQITSAIQKIKADLFAVHLHWLNFSHGAIQILNLLKETHPCSDTVVGGLTASYFKDEIMRLYPFIDFLIVGDGCIPLLGLIKQIKSNRDFSKVPNLLYRQREKIKKGKNIFLNDFIYEQNNNSLVRSIPTSRGCPLQCITCGGSKYSFRKICNYTEIHIYSIESIMKRLFDLTKKHEKNLHLFLIHDPLLTLGKRNWEILLDEIKRNRLNISFSIEFYLPHSKEDIFNIADKVPGSLIDISPESIDENVRRFHKNIKYANEDLIMNISVINNIKSLSMGVWFMAGLAEDTKSSIDKTLLFIKEYYLKIKNKKKNIFQYNELLFIDPGSLAFDYPSKYGYKLINKTFLSHMESFAMPIFKYQINYETRHYSRNQLFNQFLYIHNEMNKVYYENNVISKIIYNRITLYNNLLRKYSPRYDEALLEKSHLIRYKKFTDIGNLLRAELEK